MCIRIYVYMHVCVCIRIYVYMHACVCVWVCVYIHTHTYRTKIYTHILVAPSSSFVLTFKGSLRSCGGREVSRSGCGGGSLSLPLKIPCSGSTC